MGSNRHDDVQVEVHVDGTWWPGWLDPDDWRREPDGRWIALVRWQTGPAENHMDTFPADQIRKA